MFLDILEPAIENKNASLDKTVLVMWSQIFESYLLQNINNSYQINGALRLLVDAIMETIKLSNEHLFSFPGIERVI